MGDGEDQEPGKASDGGDQEAGKASDNGVPEDVEVGNDSMGDDAKNQDNRYVTVKDVEDSDHQVTVAVDFAVVDTVFADVLAYHFGPLSPRSNSLPNVTAACSGQSNSPPGVTTTCSGPSHGNKFKFSFTSLLTLLQDLT